MTWVFSQVSAGPAPRDSCLWDWRGTLYGLVTGLTGCRLGTGSARSGTHSFDSRGIPWPEARRDIASGRVWTPGLVDGGPARV